VAALVSGISPQVPALLTATVETDSTFSGYDANGHYGQVYMIHGPCSAGTTSPPPPGNCATPPQYGIPGAQSSSQPAGPSLSDDQLLDLLLNN
jgi:hypothetical protein